VEHVFYRLDIDLLLLLYADDLIVIAETENDLIKRLNEWRIEEHGE